MNPRRIRVELGFVLCLNILAGCVGAAPPLAGSATAAAVAHVIVARRGWHIDVGFETAQLGDGLSFIARQFPGAHYVFFGFGDERYIRSKSHHWPALLAAMWPGAGVMLVTALDNTPDQAYGASQIEDLPLSEAQWSALQAFIRNSFARVSDATSPVQSGPYAGSQYYAAVPAYSVVHTCNTWAAEALRAGDLPVQSHGVLVAGQLWRQVRPLGRSDHP